MLVKGGPDLFDYLITDGDDIRIANCHQAGPPASIKLKGTFNEDFAQTTRVEFLKANQTR